MTSALILLALSWNSNLTVAAGGLSVEKQAVTYAAWRDPKSGYFAVKVMECDGAHRSLRITKDRRLVDEAGFNTARFGKPSQFGSQEITDRAFVPVTKHGIAMGTSLTAVRKKLGKPTKTTVRGSQGEFTCLLYKQARLDRRKEGDILRNTYIFKNGKLIELLIQLDAVPGCGDDSLSDAGWPWTKF